MGLATRLYRGETEFPLVRRKKIFYTISAVAVLLCALSMLLRGFNLGTEFKGGATFQWPAKGASVEQARDLFEDLELDDAIVQTVGRGADVDLRVQTEPLTQKQIDDVLTAIPERFSEVARDEVSPSNVGPAWGKQVTKQALIGLVAFLVAVIAYISLRFEPKMAVSAIVALIHDLALTAGIYSITGSVVTPSTVIALLTILGFSLYDTIVVFDKVEENTKGLVGTARQTYGEAAELAVNQTFMRSLNTSIIALLPVSGLLFVGVYLLQAGTLKDLALALFVGLAAGAYSSLFLATPLLVDLKMREPQFKALEQRVLARRTGTATGSRFQQRAAARVAGAPLATDVPVLGAADAAPAPTTTSARPAAGRPAPGKGAKAKSKGKGGKGGRPGKRHR